MRIALDWDDTYTRNPVFWDRFIDLCLSFGVDVRIVTQRLETNPIRQPLKIPIIYTNYTQKRDHCNSVGFIVDIWIDDIPEFIPSQGMLEIMFNTTCQITMKSRKEDES